MVALGIVDQIARMNLEKLREEQARRVGEMGAGAALDLREVGLADRGSVLLPVARFCWILDGADQLLLGHGPVEAAKIAFDFTEVTDFVAEFHIADRNIYIAICNKSKRVLKESISPSKH